MRSQPSAAKSSKVEKMYCAPGNAGIEEFAVVCADRRHGI